MPRFIGSPMLEHIEGRGAAYYVRRGFTFEGECYDVGVRPGWITDGASVPRPLWNIFSPFAGRYIEAAIMHDALYRAEALPRKACDDLFLEGMKACRVPWWKRWSMYAGVRLGGWAAWANHDKEEVEEAKKFVNVKEKR